MCILSIISITIYCLCVTTNLMCIYNAGVSWCQVDSDHTTFKHGISYHSKCCIVEIVPSL